MKMAYITDVDMKRGKKNLKKALRFARQQPLDPNFQPTIFTGETVLDPYICIANIQALVIRKEDTTWCVEFVLKFVPEGFPDTVGVRPKQPLMSEQQALQHGFDMVTDQFQKERVGLAPKKPMKAPSFILGGQPIHLSYDGDF